ncbi:MAG: tRNA (adenosine(37)-N6)-threonylcarbamoyltransferase complex dimerization subunit type 1 TsaB [Oscillospiraceae bacterium]|nr:tRNA (adenosine(37)-N6)-threonylcarbamoyltransferase complex dimerization subunit type 1 TsaB [Oscillospiraceae bacterium]
MQLVILGVDCSSKQSSVCIMRDGKIIYTAVQNTNTTHSRNFLPMIQGALTVCGLQPADVNVYASTVGPGSFTGLRIGIATIKGMASANNAACIGVSSLKALAACCESDSVVVPVFDARRRQVYGAVIDGETVICDDFCRDVSHLKQFIENTEKDVIFVGDGKQLCYNEYSGLENVKPCGIEMPCIAQGACILAMKEYETAGAKTHFELSPSYLRLSQAERELKEKTEANKQ